MNLQLRVSGDERMNERKSAIWNFPTSRVRNWYIRWNKFIILKEFNTIITVLGLKSELIKVKNFSFLFARTFALNTYIGSIEMFVWTPTQVFSVFKSALYVEGILCCEKCHFLREECMKEVIFESFVILYDTSI